MKGYPLELRRKVLAAVDRGIPRKDVVRTFGLAMPTLERYVRLRKPTGEIGPPRPPGRRPYIATASCGRASRGRGSPSPPCGGPCAGWGGRKRGAAGSRPRCSTEGGCRTRRRDASDLVSIETGVVGRGPSELLRTASRRTSHTVEVRRSLC